MSDIGRSRYVRKGGVTLSANFRRNGGTPINDSWRLKKSPWAITWRCLRDPTFSRFYTIPECYSQIPLRYPIENLLATAELVDMAQQSCHLVND